LVTAVHAERPVGEDVGDEVVGDPVGEDVGDEVVGDPVGEDVGDEVVGDPVGEDVGDDVVGDPVGEVVGDDVVGELVGANVQTSCGAVFVDAASMTETAAMNNERSFVPVAEFKNVSVLVAPAVNVYVYSTKACVGDIPPALRVAPLMRTSRTAVLPEGLGGRFAARNEMVYT
jgi:hypothetical protein